MAVKKFCRQCGVIVNEGMFGFGATIYEFDDGVYCENCAIIRVQAKRKKLKERV